VDKLIPAYWYNEHLKMVQTIWVEPGTPLPRYTAYNELVFLSASEYAHSDFEWLAARIANETKNFRYFTGKKR
jgi:hypothetical protein